MVVLLISCERWVDDGWVYIEVTDGWIHEWMERRLACIVLYIIQYREGDGFMDG